MNEWPEVLDIYEAFLTWKDDNDVEKYLKEGETKRRLFEATQRDSRRFYIRP